MTQNRRLNSQIFQSNNSSGRQSIDSVMPFQWQQIKTLPTIISKRSHHSSCLHQNKMYIYGGYESGGQGVLKDLLEFDVKERKWTNLGQAIKGRHSHSMIWHKEKLVVYGGVMNDLTTTNQLYQIQFTNNQIKWTQINVQGQVPPCLSSHRCVVYEDQMIIFGGQQQQKYSQKIYSLNLQTNEWKTIADLTISNIPLRSDCSLNIYNDKLYIFGGKKDDQKFNDFWQFDLKDHTFKLLQNQNNKPFPRSGHAAVVWEKYLIVFGGTTGVTHQRNDLVYYDFVNNCWGRHWVDSQSEMAENYQKEIIKKSSRTNSIKNSSTFCSKQNGNRNSNQKSKPKLQNSKVSKNCSNLSNSSVKKYRKLLKNENYYNQNYPFYGQLATSLTNKHKKNDLLLDLQKQSLLDKSCPKVRLHLSQTFQSINNSILNNSINMSKLQTLVNEEKNYQIKQPRARDGHTAEIIGKFMVLFGGDRHHISFNDVLLIDITRIINDNKTE